MGKRVRRDSSASQVFGSAAVNPECITDESARWAPKSFTRLLHKGLGRRDTAEHSRKKSVEHLRDDDVIIAYVTSSNDAPMAERVRQAYGHTESKRATLGE